MANIRDMFPGINEVLKEKEELQKKLGKAFKKEIKEFIKQLDGVNAIRWQQYTPYFNDGDPCRFSIYGVDVQVDKKSELYKASVEKHPELVKELEDEEDPFWIEYSPYGIEKMLLPEFLKNIKLAFELEEILEECSDICEQEFGDGYTVKLTKSRIITEEYSHS